MTEAPEVKTGFTPSGAKIVPSASGRVNTSHSFTGTFLNETTIYWADSRGELEIIKAQWNAKIDAIIQETEELKRIQDEMIRDKQRREETVQNLQEDYEKYVNDNRDQHIVLSYEEWCEENYPGLLAELAASEEVYKKWVDEENAKAKAGANTRNEEETVKAAETDQTSQNEEISRTTPTGEAQETPAGPIDQKTTESGATSQEKQSTSNTPSNKYFAYTYPNFGIWAEQSDSFAWVRLDAYKNYQKGASARADYNAMQSKATKLAAFTFLFQNDDFGWTTTHKWEAYKGITSPLNSFKEGLGKAIETVKSGAGIIGNFDLNEEQMIYERFDSASVYESSTDREFELSFEWAPPPLSENAPKFWENIRMLEELTYAEKDNGNSTTFSPPSLWDIEIIPPKNQVQGFYWKFKHCACTKCGITFSGIWQRGLPTKINVSLGFKHIVPVYKDTGWWIDQDVIQQ